MKRNKLKSPDLIHKVKSLPLKAVSIFIIISLAIFLLISYIWKVLSVSDYFLVKEIVTRDADTKNLAYLKGKNILSLDLNRESERLLYVFPEYNEVRLVRIMPDRIFVDFIRRKPAALVKLYRLFAVDKDGVFFYASGAKAEEDLPVITGLETRIFGPKPGEKHNIRELALALDIIREIKANPVLRNIKVATINVSNILSASVFIPFAPNPAGEGKTVKKPAPARLEIKIGAGNIPGKIATLAELLRQSRSDLANIRYIDLRFKEPVLKLNDAK